jgi:rhomboid family GlyGly-CTERM serine protease
MRLTGHWVHANLVHVLLNAVALWLLPAILPAPSRRQWWAWLLVLSIVTSVSLFIFNPVLQQYVGLSGVLHGLYVASAIAAWSQRDERRWLSLVLGAIALKLLIEPYLPYSPTEKLIGVSVFFVAHQVGAFWGVILGVWTLYGNKPSFFGFHVSKNHL